MRRVGLVVGVIILVATWSWSTAQAAIQVNAWSGLSGDDKGRWEEMIKAFNASQKEVEVIPSFYTWDLMHSKLVASLQTGGVPEILLMWVAVIPEMARLGALAPMDELVTQAGIKGDDFVPRDRRRTLRSPAGHPRPGSLLQHGAVREGGSGSQQAARHHGRVHRRRQEADRPAEPMGVRHA
jgi:hypothetical protein